MSARTILLVEDNADDEELTRLALHRTDLESNLVVAHDGVEALDMLLSATPVRPALVLLDLKMPRLDGLDVLRRLRADQRTRLLPVVVLTSSLEDDDLVRSYGLGANSYVRKPLDFAEFNATIDCLSHYWLAVNEPPPEYRAN